MNERYTWGGVALSALTMVLAVLVDPGCTGAPSSAPAPGTGAVDSVPVTTHSPSPKPSPSPSIPPSPDGDPDPSPTPTDSPSPDASIGPSSPPSPSPSVPASPSPSPSAQASAAPSTAPSSAPSTAPSPTPSPTATPTTAPTATPTAEPSPSAVPATPTRLTLTPAGGELNAQSPRGGGAPGFVWRIAINATVTYSDGHTDSDVSWQSSDPKLGTYKQGYVETAVDAPEGVLVITAVSNRDPRFSAQATFTVTTYGGAEVTID